MILSRVWPRWKIKWLTPTKHAKREIQINKQLQDVKGEIETNNQQLQDAKREIETNNQQVQDVKRETESNNQQLQDAKRQIVTINKSNSWT